MSEGGQPRMAPALLTRHKHYETNKKKSLSFHGIHDFFLVNFSFFVKQKAR